MQGIKSLIVISYQLLTEYVDRLQKWASLKANTILNSLEVVLWLVVLILAIQGNMRICHGTSCALS